MAQLAVAAAANIAIGLALNALFPPPDIEQEGPRLADRGFTGTSYGKFINITFGTDRVDGTIIDTEDPAIEERVSTESASGGKGGGPSVNTTTYTYFLTCRIVFGIEGADSILRLWADGKLIYDVTGSDSILSGDWSLTIYPGGADQQTDPEEVTRRGADIPAYTHLTTVKLDALPLANFGNRIPNFTAEVSYNTSNSAPFLELDEPDSGIGIPGGVASFVMVDPTSNRVYSLEPSAQWYATANDLTFVNQYSTTSGFSEPAAGRDGFAYAQSGTTNSAPLRKIDTETGEVDSTVGTTGLGITDTFTRFFNGGNWFHLQTNLGELGFANMAIHINDDFGSSNGACVDTDSMGNLIGKNPIIHVFSTADGLPSQVFEGTWISDHDRGRGFLFIRNNSTSQYELHKVTPNVSVGLLGTVEITGVEVELVRTFTRGSAGDDFPSGTAPPQAWAVNEKTGDLILGNNSSLVLYNPDTNTLLASTTEGAGGIRSLHNYYRGDIIGFAIDNAVRVYDTRDLTLIQSLDTDPPGDVSWNSGNGTIHNEGTCWNDRDQAVFMSRSGSGAAVDERFVKLYVNRLTGDGVGLDFICESLCTSYQRYEMAGLTSADIDVTTVAGDNVPGYTLNRDTPVTNAFDPLRNAYLFDIVQSDWIIKFPKRGQAPVLTVAADDIGELRRGRRLQDAPPLRESREDEIALPMRLNVRYRNQDIDYDNDVEHDKRYATQNPTISTRREQTLDIPVVQEPEFMKRVAQKWLWTLWNERVTYQTIIPWTYITLDPTDVFNMNVFGETVQLRMTELDTAAGWQLGITGVQEDTENASSTIGGGANDGFNGQNIASSLPTKLFQLDTPLLDTGDILTTDISNAYVAFSAFEDTWPGGTSNKSQDNVEFANTASANVEAVTAKVTVAPGAWGYVDRGLDGDGLEYADDFRNRWQEVAEGGSMTIRPLRRTSVWASATELAVLNGANSIAVNTDNGVEIIQFQDVTVNTDNTVTLERLLRGRLGTEDIADAGGPGVNDVVVLLSDSTGTKETGPIAKQKLTTSELNISLFFRGVTNGTLIEDATSEMFTYTGRDIQPYSIVHMQSDPQPDGTFDLSWQRRCRGPFAAEWLDGSGTIPFNETIEQYTVEVVDASNNIGFTTTVDDDDTLTLTGNQAGSITPPTFARVRQNSGVSGFSSPDVPSARVQLLKDGQILVIDDNDVDLGGVTTSGSTAAVQNAIVDDVLVVTLTGANDGPSTTGPVSGDPTYTFTQIGVDQNDINGTISTARFSSMWYRVITDTEPADGIYDFSWVDTAFIHISHVLLRFVDLTRLPDSTSLFDQGIPSSTTVTAASLSPAVGGAVGVFSVSSRANDTNSSIPPGFSYLQSGEDFTPSSNDEFFFGMGIKTFENSGPTGTQTWVWPSVAFNLKAFHWALFEPL